MGEELYGRLMCKKISIIIPVYNAERFLRRCLDSVLNQSYSNWECIIVDDGSKDSSFAICDEYVKTDSRFKVIHKENGGVSEARNIGLSQLSGEWVTFVDSDDELTLDALKYFTEGMERYPKASVLRGGHKTVTPTAIGKDRLAEKWICTESHADALKISEETWCSGFMWLTCFRKDIIEGMRFDNSITWCEDHIFTYQCILKAEEIAFVPHVVYVYYLDDTYPAGFGKNLSFKPISYNMAIRSAEEQRKVKLLLAGGNKKMQQMVQLQYEATIRFAIYQSFFTLNLLSVISLAEVYPFITTKNVIRLWLGYQKTRIIHTYKVVFNKY